MQFVRKNMRSKTIIDPLTGRREDRMDYPMTAVRETIVNALVHRDYSMHTEGMPIRLILFEDRMEIRNPGGIYGRIRADKLGKVQPDTRNPVLASALEVLGMTENRYSGIPTIRKVMQESGLPQPVFCDERGSFVVTFRKEMPQAARASDPHAAGSLAGALVSRCLFPAFLHRSARCTSLPTFEIWVPIGIAKKLTVESISSRPPRFSHLESSCNIPHENVTSVPQLSADCLHRLG